MSIITVPCPQVKPLVVPGRSRSLRIDRKPSLASRLWMSETTALLLTSAAFEAMEQGEDHMVDEIWQNTDEESRESFRTYLKMLGSPAIGWFSWINLCWSGSQVRFPVPSEPINLPEFEANPRDELEWLGFDLAYKGFSATAPTGSNAQQRAAFDRGTKAALALLYTEACERQAWLDQAYAALPELDYSESIEVLGCVETHRMAI